MGYSIQWNSNKMHPFSLEKWIRKCRLQNGSHFISACVDTPSCQSSSAILMTAGGQQWWFEITDRGHFMESMCNSHDDVIKWKHFPRYWPFVRGIHRGPVNSPHKGEWRGAFMFSLICALINRWGNNREAGDLRRYRPHYDVIVMYSQHCACTVRYYNIYMHRNNKTCVTHIRVKTSPTTLQRQNPLWK